MGSQCHVQVNQPGSTQKPAQNVNAFLSLSPPTLFGVARFRKAMLRYRYISERIAFEHRGAESEDTHEMWTRFCQKISSSGNIWKMTVGAHLEKKDNL